MLKNLNQSIDLLEDLIFPRNCKICQNPLFKEEIEICRNCFPNLPRTFYEWQKGNLLDQRLWGRVPIEHSWSYFFFLKGGAVSKLIREIKYRHSTSLAYYLGKCYGRELAKLPNRQNWPELIIPVPLHPKKEKIRGYNQSLFISQGLAEGLGLPVKNALSRVKHTPSQTHHKRSERWANVSNAFSIEMEVEVFGKRVLLVDDVFTTGATLEACSTVLLENGAKSVSICTLAVAMD